MQILRIAGLLLANSLAMAATAQQRKIPVTDSLKAAVEKRLENAGGALKSTLRSSVDSLLPLQKQVLNTTEWKGLLQEASGMPQQAFSKINLLRNKPVFKQDQIAINTGYTYFRDTSGIGLGMLNSLESIYNYDLSGGIAMFNLPVAVSFRGTNGMYITDYTPFDKLVQFNFDQKKYIETLRSKVVQQLDPNIVLAATMDRINAIKSNYEKMLQQEIASLQNEFNQKYQSALQLPDGITDLSKTDLSVLKSKLMAASNALPGSIADSIAAGNMVPAKKLELLQNVYEKIVAAKDRFESNKLVKQLKTNLPFTPRNYASFLKEPANLQKVLDDHVDLSFIQRLFVNMERFNLGQNAVQDGEFDLQNLINTGVNAGFKGKKASAEFLYGRNNNINNWLQAGLLSNVTNEYSSVAGMKLGTGTNKSSEQSISVNFFDFKDFSQLSGLDLPLRSAYMAMPQRRDATITFHSGFSLSSKHTVKVDVSKSFGSYSNNMLSDSQTVSSNAHSGLISDAGKSNFAAMIDYTGEILNSDVSLVVKKVGLGYNNPGNVLLRSGETKVGLGLARKFLNRDLGIRYNIDYSRRDFDPLKRYIHISLNNKLQLTYRFNRNNRIGLTWQRSDMDSKLFAQGESNGVNSRLQADGAYAFRITGKKISSNVTISHQLMNVPMMLDQYYKSRSVMLMHNAVMVVNKNPLSLMLLLNRSNNKDYLFNTSMFTSELSYTYAITGAVRFGNSMGYYANTGWNKQIGIRQQVSATLIEKLNMDVDVSYKKAVQSIRPELANQLFITAGMHFIL